MISLSFVDLTINFFCIVITYWIVKKIFLNLLYNLINEINNKKIYNEKMYYEKRDTLLQKKKTLEESLEKVEYSLKKIILNASSSSLVKENNHDIDNAIFNNENNFSLQKKDIQNLAESLYSKTLNTKHIIRN